MPRTSRRPVTLWLASLLALALACAAAPASAATLTYTPQMGQFDSGVDNQGWWAAASSNSDDNQNYYVGRNGSEEIRNFFTFQVPELCATAATLKLQRYQGSGSGPLTYTLFDVATPAADLNDNTGFSVSIFDDLGSGTSYGSYPVATYGSPTDIVSFPLNAAGVAALNAAGPGYFSIGGAIVPASSGGYLFGFSFASGVQELEVVGTTGACDPDTDRDGLKDSVDNCPNDANPSQANHDGDAKGDACDPDDDNDGALDGSDAFPLNPDERTDTDRDGLGNNADTDDDGDGVADVADAFPLDERESVDTDRDGTGDNADADDDNDDTPDARDACAKVAGQAQNGCPMPKQVHQCANDGWKNYGTTFSGQGACTRWVLIGATQRGPGPLPPVAA